jgi:hypothetical protein
LDIISSEKEGVIKTFSWNELDRFPEVDTIIHLAGKAHDTKKRSKINALELNKHRLTVNNLSEAKRLGHSFP